MCDYFKKTYTELIAEPAWFIQEFQAYLEGKAKAEEAKMKKNQVRTPQAPAINKYKFTARKR